MSYQLESSSVVSLTPYVAMLKRRKRIISIIFAGALLIALVIAVRERPMYISTARLLVEDSSDESETVDASNPLSNLYSGDAPLSLTTQVAMLTADPLMDKVYDQFGDVDLNVDVIKDTNIIEVTGSAPNKDAASDGANLLLDSYLQQTSDSDLQSIVSASDFVNKQLDGAYKDLAQSNAALLQLRIRTHVSDVDAERNAVDTQIATLTTEIQNNTANLNAIKAQTSVESSLFKSQPSTLTNSLVATNPEVADLQTQIQKLETQRAGMVQPGGFTDRSPEVRALDGQIDELEVRLGKTPPTIAVQQSAINDIHDSLNGKLVDDTAQNASLRAAIGSEQSEIQALQSRENTLDSYEASFHNLINQRDNAVARVKQFTSNLADLNLRDKAYRPHATIIQRASPADVPTSPKRLITIVFGALVGLFLAVCAALIMELFDDRMYEVKDVELELGMPVIGRIPVLPRAELTSSEQSSKRQELSESFRLLRTNVYFASIDNPVKHILVTSPGRGEGKSTNVMNLAASMILDGKSVIIVDTDLRSPSIEKMLNLSSSYGLTDVLLGNKTIAEVLASSAKIPNLRCVSVGELPPNPTELLGSKAFRNIMAELGELADIVIYDSPPLMAAADASIMSSIVDGVLLVVQPGSTKKRTVHQAVQMLENARARVLGVIYNGIEDAGLIPYYNEEASQRDKKLTRTSKKFPARLSGNKVDDTVGPIVEAES